MTKLNKNIKIFRNWLFYESEYNYLILFFIKILNHFCEFLLMLLELLFNLLFTSDNIFNNNKSNSENNILWCSVCNDYYIDGLLVLLYSIKKHNPDFDYPFKIYHNNDLSILNQNKIIKIYKNIIFEENSIFNNLNKLYMCMLPFKEKSYDKVIFIDADILCLGDISYLNQCNTDYFSACLDTNIKMFWNSSYNIYSYLEFNSGLFVIPKKILKNQEIYNDLIDLSFKYPNENLGDQNILNKYFQLKKINKLPGKYNVKKNVFSFQNLNEKNKPILLHFVGADKPFLTNNRSYIKTKNNQYYQKIYNLYKIYMIEMKKEFKLV